MMESAAVRFLPTMIICPLPLVCRPNASAIDWPIPEVPPTNTATGEREEKAAALAARIAESVGIGVRFQWIRVARCLVNLFERFQARQPACTFGTNVSSAERVRGVILLQVSVSQGSRQ